MIPTEPAAGRTTVLRLRRRSSPASSITSLWKADRSRGRWSDSDAIEAFGLVWTTLVARLGGDGWKRSEEVIERLRADRYPALLGRSRKLKN